MRPCLDYASMLGIYSLCMDDELWHGSMHFCCALAKSATNYVVLNYVATKYVVLNCSFAALDECVQGQLDSVAAHVWGGRFSAQNDLNH